MLITTGPMMELARWSRNNTVIMLITTGTMMELARSRKNTVIMLKTTGPMMELARWSKRARTSMTAVIVIRPRGDGDVEEAADDETASVLLATNLPIIVLVVGIVKCVKKIDEPKQYISRSTCYYYTQI
jgi:hypothetical protein